jgi:RHS repeat-associated protein
MGVAVTAGAHPGTAVSPCDINGDGLTNATDVQLVINEALGKSAPANDLSGDGQVNAVDVEVVIRAALNQGCFSSSGLYPIPTITTFNPSNGPVGTLVTITGNNLGVAPQVSMPQQGGGTISLPLSAMTSTSLSFVIPSGAASGLIAVNNGNGVAFTSSAFTVTPSTTFSLAVSPASANLIQGQSVAYAIQVTSANGFDQLARLSVAGVPAGVTATFAPSSVAAGQTGVLTLTAPPNQAISTANLSITAAATVQNLPVTQSSPVSLAVVAPTTSLIGRTVVSNPQETPLAGVTISSLGQDGNGNATGCTGHTTTADAAGNFALTNLPQACTGPQLFNFNGLTATSPAGQYAGVNLAFTLTLGQVTPSPVLVHLPQINNVETFYVQQNAGSDQTYSYASIPGLSLTVYAGTTLTLPDGTKPNPFPLAAVQVPVDRLPDMKPNVPTMVRVFIVAFQPAESTANQPVAVWFPNVSNTAPGTDMPLMTLDPTHGTMVPYGTGAVSADGTQVVPDMDPAHAGHRYGLVHFDWHGQMPPPANQSNLGSGCGCSGEGAPPTAADPVDLSSGIQVLWATDLAIQGGRGSIAINRVYRTLTANDGPFGLGSESSYGWELDTRYPESASAINLIAPDGNQYLFSRQADSTLTNSSVPFLQGAVMTTNASGVTNLRYRNGTVYQFQPLDLVSPLYSITDRNNNSVSLTQTQITGTAIRITQITDPVGRALTLAYDANGHCTSVTDPIGRKVTYTYNATGTLATETDPNGGVTSYQYDSQNRVTSMTDPRGVVMFQDVYDANGHVIQQTRPDGGIFTFAYVMANPLAATSPIISTTVTDPLGNQTTYRFNIQGYMTDITDALGQMKSLARDPATNLVLQVTGSAQCAVCGSPGQGPMSYTYDANGNTLTATDALGDIYKLTYDPIFSQITSITDPLNHTQTFAYDAAGDLTTATDENGHSTSLTYDANGQPLTVTDPLGNTSALTYDASENPVAVTDALGNTTQNTFDAVSRLLSSTDPMRRRTTINYDILNRVVSVIDGRGSVTQFSYDAVGNLLTLTDPKKNATNFTYDSLSRVSTRTNALGKAESYQYDLAGNLSKYTDRRTQVSTFQYDPLNRLASESYQDGATVARSYDPYSRLLAVNDSVGGAFGFAYDAAGRLITQSEPTGTVNYSRDALGRVATRQVAGQAVVAYSYDPAGNMLGAAMPAAGVTFSYDARNLPSQETRTNGVSSAYTFDPLGRVLSLIHSKGAAALNTQTYSYDASGNRIGGSNDISQPLITQAATASVDAANELLANAQTTYTYDANGNRLTESGPNGSYTYVWDGRNRLASITDGSGNRTSFKYDFLRNLTEIDRTGGGVAVQKFVFDEITNLASLTDPSGLPVSLLSGTSIDSHVGSVDSTGEATFGIADPLDSTVATTSSSGGLIAELEYEPYGQTTGAAPTAYPFTYTGRIPVVGNILYYRNRFFDAGTGRFLSEDPLGPAAGDLNLSRYVLGDPISGGDPAGLEVRLTIHPRGADWDDFKDFASGAGEAAAGVKQAEGGWNTAYSAAGPLEFGGGLLELAPVLGPLAPVAVIVGLGSIGYGLYEEYNGVTDLIKGIQKTVSGLEKAKRAIDNAISKRNPCPLNGNDFGDRNLPGMSGIGPG